eukprot:UN05717
MFLPPRFDPITKWFLEQPGIELNNKFRLGGSLLLSARRCPIHVAMFKPVSEDIIKMMLNKIDVNIQDSTGTAPLHTAAGSDSISLSILQLLLTFKKIDINIRNDKGKTALSLAVNRLKPNKEKIRLLLDHKDLNINSRDHRGMSTMMHAAKKGHVNIVQELLAF